MHDIIHHYNTSVHFQNKPSIHSYYLCILELKVHVYPHLGFKAHLHNKCEYISTAIIHVHANHIGKCGWLRVAKAGFGMVG